MTSPAPEPHRSELDKLWQEIAALRSVVGDLKTKLEVSEANRKHLDASLVTLAGDVKAMSGKVDALITALASARGQVGLGVWVLGALGSLALLAVGWMLNHLPKWT